MEKNKQTHEWINQKGELVMCTADEYEKYRNEYVRIITFRRKDLPRRLYMFELDDANKPFAGEKDPRWHESWIPLMKLIADPNITTYMDKVLKVTQELNSIIIVVSYKNGSITDYWLTHNNGIPEIHSKKNLEIDSYFNTGKNKYDTISLSDIRRGSPLSTEEMKRLLEDKYIKQQFKYGKSVFEEEHFLFNREEFTKFVNEFDMLI